MKKLKVKAPKALLNNHGFMATLGLGKLTAVEGRARLLRPEAVNRAIHALAIQARDNRVPGLHKKLGEIAEPR